MRFCSYFHCSNRSRCIPKIGSGNNRNYSVAHLWITWFFPARLLVAFLPTLVTKKIIYGSYLDFGYTEELVLELAGVTEGLFLSAARALQLDSDRDSVGDRIVFLSKDRSCSGLYSIIALAAFLYVIGCYQDWHGLSSFGNRFFVSLTAIFVLGLSAFLNYFARVLSERRVRVFAPIAVAIFIVWNLGLIFQWGTHLIPARGPISWRTAAYNQVAVVPVQVAGALQTLSHSAKTIDGQYRRPGRSPAQISPAGQFRMNTITTPLIIGREHAASRASHHSPERAGGFFRSLSFGPIAN